MDIYTDGSFNKKATTDASGWAVVVVLEDRHDSYLCDIFYGVITDEAYTKMWNVGGELYAAIFAIDLADREYKPTQLRIFHDYMGLFAWAAGTWQAKKDVTRDYRNFVKKHQQNRQISFRHVKGHSGSVLNDVADHYAQKGIQKFLEDKSIVHKISQKEIPKKR